MLLMYVGEREVDLIPNHVYEVKKIHDDLGDGYAIFDEGDDWYCYDVNFVRKNFVAFEEKTSTFQIKALTKPDGGGIISFNYKI